MPDSTPQTPGRPPLDDLIEIRQRLRALTVRVTLLSLILTLTVAAIFGQLVEYYAFDPLIFGAATIGAAILGFGLGVWVGRKTA